MSNTAVKLSSTNQTKTKGKGPVFPKNKSYRVVKESPAATKISKAAIIEAVEKTLSNS